MSVVPFAKKSPSVPHGSGTAFCIACAEEWAAVAPIGVEAFECPSCHRHTGHWKFEFSPAVGQMVRQCNCGNRFFYLTPEGHLCASCGTFQTY